jgi:hypothetical protein
VGSTQNFLMLNLVAGAITSGLWGVLREIQRVLFAADLNFLKLSFFFFFLELLGLKRIFWLKYSVLINSRYFSFHFCTILPTYLKCCTLLRTNCTVSKIAKMYPNGKQAHEFAVASRRNSRRLALWLIDTRMSLQR